ncbi:hypothetical protein SYNPS1DRAFT_21607 [Syncephalis pseudoplumigaleata]|uniref:Uncharacterized protein n=1 Tax=Syncephalis pseudoplumigaleata TaxID=1712513 RepID=A0A4P9Z2D2_9FUNG|nr:hypothetical protein SYNPS1DRAFT_21607 [Syncephalis pseudoplumigaleata]|eukprot:RKP26673.1 hypothetical protein SYNPS1DRAFT_21607 [Syncephalis pseudoplumigaleata]
MCGILLRYKGTAYPDAHFHVARISEAGFPVTPAGEEMHLIEYGLNEYKWLTEEEVWEWKRRRIGFMDITQHRHEA